MPSRTAVVHRPLSGPVTRPPRRAETRRAVGAGPFALAGRPGGVAVAVRDLVAPAPVRIARAVADAAIVRDVAAFAALVVLATMLSVLSALDGLV